MSDISNEIEALKEIIRTIKLPEFLCPIQAQSVLSDVESRVACMESSEDVIACREVLFCLFTGLNDEIAMLYPLIRRDNPKQLRLVHDFANSLVSRDNSVQNLQAMKALLAGFTPLKSRHIVN